MVNLGDWRNFEFGLHDELLIREESWTPGVDGIRIAYISDIHLRRGRSRILCGQILRAVSRSCPDVILLGGDLLDQMSELAPLTELVRSLSQLAVTFAIAGNHDITVGVDSVRAAVEDGDGIWVHEEPVELCLKGRPVIFYGPSCSLPSNDRCGAVHVLCAHKPNRWRRDTKNGFDVVFAGHLHGCQAVIMTWKDWLFPGAFFYRGCFLRKSVDRALFLVSRGVSDLIPIRWRCPREIVICRV